MPPAFAEIDSALGGLILPIDISKLIKGEDLRQQFMTWLDSSKYNDADFVQSKNLLEREALFGLYPSKKFGSASNWLKRELESRDLIRYEGVWGETYDDPSFFVPKPGESPAETALRAEREQEAARESERQIYMPKDIALHYLSLCGSQLAEEKQADLFAHNDSFAETAITKAATVKADITYSLLKAYIPEDLENLPLAQLREIREGFSTQRLKFQAAVNSLCEEFVRVTSEQRLHDKQREIESIAKERIEQTKKTYRRAKLTMITTALGIGLIPSAMSSLSSMLGIGVFAPAAITTALATASASFLLQREKARDEYKTNNWSYVLEVARQIPKRSKRPL